MTVNRRIERYLDTDGPRHVLVTRIEDIRWLTGFTGGTAEMLVDRTEGSVTLFVDGRYAHRARTETATAGADVAIVEVRQIGAVEDHLSRAKARECGVDPHHVDLARMRRLEEVCRVIDEADHLADLRRVKDEVEIAALTEAARVADLALAEVVADGLLGRTEREVRARLEHLMMTHGADDRAFDTIVATGANAASAHHEPGSTVIESGHGVVIDMGARIDGYRSDMTRTILVGAVRDEYRTMFDLVREAQSAALAAVAAGVEGRVIDEAARAVFRRAGVEHELTHGTGHGIGLQIHEMPVLSPRCGVALRSGEVVTVEPGLYRGGVGGVRIEDLVVVTDTGCRVLTLSPKELSCPRSPRTT